MSLTVTIALDETERAALSTMATEDCRPLREQLRFLFRAEAQRRGLIQPNATANTTTNSQKPNDGQAKAA